MPLRCNPWAALKNMSIQDMARAALAHISTQHSDSAVTVKYKGASCTGVSDTENVSSQLTDNGEVGATIGTVRVDASDIEEPDRGSTITIDDVDMIVMSVKRDPLDAILTIEYSEQRVITEV